MPGPLDIPTSVVVPRTVRRRTNEEDKGYRLGTALLDAVTGGLDLSELGLREVDSGRFVATVASSMSMWFERAVLVHDPVMGIDLGLDPGTVVRFPTLVATRSNVLQLTTLAARLPSLDARPFSKVTNPALKRYDFSPPALMPAAAGQSPQGRQ